MEENNREVYGQRSVKGDHRVRSLGQSTKEFDNLHER